MTNQCILYRVPKEVLFDVTSFLDEKDLVKLSVSMSKRNSVEFLVDRCGLNRGAILDVYLDSGWERRFVTICKLQPLPNERAEELYILAAQKGNDQFKRFLIYSGYISPSMAEEQARLAVAPWHDIARQFSARPQDYLEDAVKDAISEGNHQLISKALYDWSVPFSGGQLGEMLEDAVAEENISAMLIIASCGQPICGASKTSALKMAAEKSDPMFLKQLLNMNISWPSEASAAALKAIQKGGHEDTHLPILLKKFPHLKKKLQGKKPS
jgi:hypothetical protein